jgi:hypothetical protein
MVKIPRSKHIIMAKIRGDWKNLPIPGEPHFLGNIAGQYSEFSRRLEKRP